MNETFIGKDGINHAYNPIQGNEIKRMKRSNKEEYPQKGYSFLL